MLTDLELRCETIELCYEFTLAYAAQGLPTDQGSPSGKQLREHLARAVEALRGIEKSCADAASREQLEPRREVPGLLPGSRAGCSKFVSRPRPRSRTAGHQLSVDRQPERLHASSRPARRSVSDHRNPENAPIRIRPHPRQLASESEVPFRTMIPNKPVKFVSKPTVILSEDWRALCANRSRRTCGCFCSCFSHLSRFRHV